MIKKTSALKEQIHEKRARVAIGRRKASIRLRNAAFFEAAYKGELNRVEASLLFGVPVDLADKVTGMTALHLAVGRNNLELARFLVQHGASFVPDKQGRMPTTIAAECEVSEELCDFIVEAEAAFEARAKGV